MHELEDRDQPRRAVVGTPDDVTPREWEHGPVTGRQRVAAVARGGPAAAGLVAKLAGLVRALGSALS